MAHRLAWPKGLPTTLVRFHSGSFREALFKIIGKIFYLYSVFRRPVANVISDVNRPQLPVTKSRMVYERV